MKSIDVLTIDGPAGAGKSSVAREVARRLGFRFLDTGAMYRAITLAALEAGIDARQEAPLEALCARLRIDFDDEGRILLDGVDRSEDIRSLRVTDNVSAISAVPCVRRAMSAAQREIGRDGRLVCEGRDMGSVVFPEAVARVYLDATPEVRARRRQAELAAKGQSVDFAELLAAIRARDLADSTRSEAPLVRVEGQVYVDSSDRSREQVVETILRIAVEKLFGA